MSERGLGSVPSESDSGEDDVQDSRVKSVEWVIQGFADLKQDRLDSPVYTFGPHKWYVGVVRAVSHHLIYQRRNNL